MLYNILLDFETTGVNPLKDLPVQVAYAVYDYSGEELEAISYYINPEMACDSGARLAHNISEDTIRAEGVSLSEFSERWHKLIWKYRSANVLGYNIINFDQIILQRVLGENKQGRFKYPPVEKIVDVMFLAQRFFRTASWPRLQEAVNRLGIPHNPNSFHDALEDIRYTWKVYEKLVMKK